MGLLNQLFGGSSSGAAKEMLDQGAVIVDVRTPGEFQGGHVAGSKNIPLQQIQSKEAEIMKMKKVIFCCASGGRSGQATSYFKSKGLECVNGGGWTQVNAIV